MINRYIRFSALCVALVLSVVVLSAVMARAFTTPAAACGAVQYVIIREASYTPDEAARRLNARAGYVVRPLRYAPPVERGRQVARQ